MKGYVLVLDTPFFTIPSSGGQYSLAGIPAGTYTVIAWHPKLPEQRMQVTVPDSGDTVLDIQF